MNRFLRSLATLVAALAISAGAFGARAAPQPDWLVRASVGSGAAHVPGSDYPLDRIPVASRVIIAMKDHYVDPSRFRPKEMLVAALEAVEHRVAEVMVQGDARSGRLTLTVGSAQRELDISGVNSVWEITSKLREALGFLQAHLVAPQDLREIEYAAVNGMLSTLDPHTVLLEPKNSKEMKLQTRGEFGGLGFVIGMRDGNLTVVKVLKSTPAQRAGIKPKDVITRIDEQSTVNLDLQDAVDRLRGRPQTKVSITVQHPGAEPRKLRLAREMINVETVSQARLLAGDVGYVRLSQFSGNTSRDLQQALLSEKAQAGGHLTGIVLDLRNNPGGLLDQAIQVSDLFLAEGVIEKTVAHADKDSVAVHEVKEAHAEPTDILNVPLVLIVNSNSASASEIVAGALKNNNRALVIGRQTFGKGSVQVLYDVNDPDQPDQDPPTLKLTIAQYLTPGDVSIQETGITPDVLLVPGRALKEQVNVFAPPRSTREADLAHHFTNGGPDKAGAPAAEAGRRPPAEKPALELHYLLDEKEDEVARQLRKEAAAAQAAQAGSELTPEEQEDEDSEADPDTFVEDTQIRFAAELVRRAPNAWDRPRLLEAARGLVTERREEEEERLERRLKELGVDWASASEDGGEAEGGAPRAVVTVSPPPNRDLRAGETLSWTVTVENRGDDAYHRLRAWSSCEKNPLLDRREFVFGTIEPGERRSWTVPVKLPRGLDTGRDEVVFHFESEGGKAPDDLTTTVSVVEAARPVFAFSVQVDDREGGNGDGLPQRGESFAVRVDVRNSGTGPSGDKTFVLLKNLGDEKLFITKGREVLGAMKPGEVRSAVMQVELRRGSASETLPVRVTVLDEKTDQYVSEELDIPVARDQPAPAPAQGVVKVQVAEALLRAGASATSPVLATARKGAVLAFDGKGGEFYRVRWGAGRMAFAAASDVAAAPRSRKPAGLVAEAWQRDPPRIALSPDPARSAPLVDAETLHLTGSATVPPSAEPSSRLRDLYVLVNDQKVFFKVQPESGATSRMDFATDVPLKPGANAIHVVAEEDEEFRSVRSITVLRKQPPALANDAGRGTKPEESVTAPQ
ncbi:MAG TPA: MXAN_5808 family serine peptidase [Anaeromyxobacter sp.]|nr:MXAN_5808 family serine peptidase [Anaeromyxobacter sp.]